METIVFLDRDTLDAELRPPAFEHRWVNYGATRPEEAAERLAEASVAVTNKVPLRAELLSRLPRLRMIAVAATGTDNVDVDYCRGRGIEVSNVRGYARTSVPEHVFALMLALRRQVVAYREDVRAGAWQRSEHFCLLTHPIRDLRGSALGVVGYGTLGRAVGQLARAFGMEVLVAEHKGAPRVRDGRLTFEEVLRRSDVLTLHVPLNEETRHTVGRAELSLMKRTAVLINCARGGVVAEAALAEALLDSPNLIVTPHVAWASREAMQALADQLVANIEAFVLRGERS